MSFNFSAKPTTNATPSFGTGTGITFGTPTTQTQPSFSFGSSAVQPQPQQPGGFQGFGSTTAQATVTPTLGGFGTPQQTAFKPGGLVAPTSQSIGAGSGGLFGNTGGLSFGTPAATSGGGLSFTPAATTSALTFGTSAAPSAGGALSFGTPTLGAPAGGLSFGTPAATSASGGLTFGSTTTGTGGGLTFGTPASTSTGLTFGATPAATSAGGLTFGATPAATNTGLFSTSSTSGLNFGGSTSQSQVQPLNLGLTTSGSGTGLNFGLTTTSQPNTTITVAATVSGLGGTPGTQTKQNAAQKEIPVKEQAVPNEILQTVNHFKEMVKQQKMYSSEIARCSVRDIRKVEQDIDYLTKLLNKVELQLQKNRHLAEKLKYDTAKCHQDVEMAQRTQDTPPNLQYENTAPIKFFQDLAGHFEREMQNLKLQIETAEKYVKSHQTASRTASQDIQTAIKSVHDTFVALAGKLQSIHTQVEAQKEWYLQWLREQNDDSNPFEEIENSNVGTKTLGTSNHNFPVVEADALSGPTPFNNIMLGSGMLQQSSGGGFPDTTAKQSTNLSFGGVNTSSPFASGISFGNQSGAFNSTNFQLQKPPTGNKRGKQ